MPTFIDPKTHDEDTRTIKGHVVFMDHNVPCVFTYEYRSRNLEYRIVSAFEVGKPEMDTYQLIGMFTFGDDMFATIEAEIWEMLETVKEPCDADDVSDYPGEGYNQSIS